MNYIYNYYCVDNDDIDYYDDIVDDVAYIIIDDYDDIDISNSFHFIYSSIPNTLHTNSHTTLYTLL